MENPQKEKLTYTYEEYLQIEAESEERLEYHFGEVFALAGSSKRHNILTNRAYTALSEALEGKACQVFTMDIKAEIIPRGKYLYPDLILTCDKDDLADEEEMLVRNPILIVEVLSKSTEARDRVEKFKSYIRIPSLQYYLLISQEEVHVELYARQRHDFWHYTSYAALEQRISFPALDIELGLEQIYQGSLSN
jgi:Uma2 family endonuclease